MLHSIVAEPHPLADRLSYAGANVILMHGPGAHDLPEVVDFGLVKHVEQDDDVQLARDSQPGIFASW